LILRILFTVQLKGDTIQSVGTKTPERQWLYAEEQHAWREYLHASRLLEAVLDRDLQENGLQLTEYEIICVLSEHPDRRLRMSAIAELVVQSRSRLTHTAGRLESRGWVRRESCVGDRRGVELALTEAGCAEVLRMAPIHARSVRENLVDHLLREDFLALGRTMAVVGRGIKNAAAQSVEECEDVLVPEERPA
jgi:DNA-binding MarR family transcriptional regulator